MSDKSCQSTDKINNSSPGTKSGLPGSHEYRKAPQLSTAKIIPNSAYRGQGKK